MKTNIWLIENPLQSHMLIISNTTTAYKKGGVFMSLRNYFYRFGKYILTFFFVTLLMVLFGPLRAQAAITKEVTSDGLNSAERAA